MNVESLIKNPKAKKTGLIIVGSIIVLYLAIGSWLNKISVSETNINRAWGALRDNCDQRVKMLPQFGQLVQYYLPQNRNLYIELAGVYNKASQFQFSDQILTTEQDGMAFASLQQEIVHALTEMEKEALKSTQLSQNRQYFMLKMQLKGIEQQILQSETNLKREVGYYNYFITAFPRNIANALILHKQPKKALEIATIEKTDRAPQS